jgi:hypothetical protein
VNLWESVCSFRPRRGRQCSRWLGEYFDEKGLLKSNRLRDFENLMDKLRQGDDQAVVYSDVLG